MVTNFFVFVNNFGDFFWKYMLTRGMMVWFYGGILSCGSGCWFFNLRMCSIRDVRCCMDMILLLVSVSCTIESLIFNVSFRILINGMCVEPLTLILKMRNGATFHPSF